jgi:hypothetical protein
MHTRLPQPLLSKVVTRIVVPQKCYICITVVLQRVYCCVAVMLCGDAREPRPPQAVIFYHHNRHFLTLSSLLSGTSVACTSLCAH